MGRRALLAATWLAALHVPPGAARAQAAPAFPSRPIRLLVPFPPGGASDILTRLAAQAREDSGILGEMLATRLKVLGVGGVVCDGGMRDLAEIRAVGLPMFQRIGAPPPSFANLMLADVNVAVACGGVAVFPGDTVVADEDGVAVCPAHLAEAVLPAALEQDRLERYVRRRVEAGEPLVGLYPPGERVAAEYAAWMAAGEPEAR